MTFIDAIEQHFESFFQRHLTRGVEFSSKIAQYHFSTGGKRLRALIPLQVFQACGENPEKALALGCAIEMIHNATLVHDDLQDGDTVRRGKPTVWKKWSPAQAINGGDAMFEFAVELISEMPIDPARLISVIRAVTAGTLRVIEGQSQEFLMKDEPFPSFSRYLGVIEGKTAALIETAVTSALIALGKPQEVVALASNAALQIGILFQLQDDLLDLYGEKGRDRVGSDIAEGKVSALIAAFYDRASEAEREQVKTILTKGRDETTDDDIRTVLSLLESSGAKREVIQNVQTIQQNLRDHALAQHEPKVLELIQGLSAVFLKPIEGLIS